MFERTVKTTYHYKGRMLNLRDDEVMLESGKMSRREIVEHPGAVCVAAITKDKKIVLVEQYRKAVEQTIIEIPAGLVNKGEALKTAAIRELKEETGYVAAIIEEAGSAYTSPGYSTELIHYFIARNLKISDKKNDEDEHTEVLLLSFKEAFSQIKTGKIKDNKTIIGIYLANEAISE